MIEEYRVDIEGGLLNDIVCDWLSENTTDTYTISVQEKWNPGKVDWSAMYSRSILIIRFCAEEDALAFKLRWS